MNCELYAVGLCYVWCINILRIICLTIMWLLFLWRNLWCVNKLWCINFFINTINAELKYYILTHKKIKVNKHYVNPDVNAVSLHSICNWFNFELHGSPLISLWLIWRIYIYIYIYWNIKPFIIVVYCIHFEWMFKCKAYK